MKYLLYITYIYLLFSLNVYAGDRLELETTFIKGNKELPQIIYIVPWKDIKSTRKKPQKIVLFSLFGDLFEPVYPQELSHKVTSDK